MAYIEDYWELRANFASLENCFDLDTITVCEQYFTSGNYKILPGDTTHLCAFHNEKIASNYLFYTDIGSIKGDLSIKDIDVAENKRFKYFIIKPKGCERAKKATFLFHGFNEKNWDKYLTWAKTICEKTQSAVILFPIAFHMHRAPEYWSNKRHMFKLSEARQKRFPNIIHSTLSNVAISMRLHSMPQRFIWSGLQTYYDIIQFIEDCKSGNHPHISADFSYNIFAYSVGGMLAEILKLSNYKNYFQDTKVCLFCSGAVFNRLSPVSKFILDSEANVALYSFLVEHFDKFLVKDNALRHFITEGHAEGQVFHAMLDYQKMREFRDSLFKKWEKDFYAITLNQDAVIPSFEVMNTLKGAYRDINIPVENIDFEHKYSHENPFPINKAEAHLVEKNFTTIFEKFCSFLNNK